jgi:hypothetical protein
LFSAGKHEKACRKAWSLEGLKACTEARRLEGWRAAGWRA